jgi:hypothetical protein
MMENLLRRGEDLASQGQQKKIDDVAAQLRAIFGSAAVQVQEAQVLVTGRGMIKRWLIDPSLRFLAGGLK